MFLLPPISENSKGEGPVMQAHPPSLKIQLEGEVMGWAYGSMAETKQRQVFWKQEPTVEPGVP